MYCPGITVFLVLFVNCNYAHALSTSESPFGITFTPTTVIASRINISGNIEIFKHPLGSGYQAVYQDALMAFETPEFGIRDLSSVQVFRAAIKPITEGLSERLGHPPEYKALFVPSISRPNTRDAAAEGVLGEDHDEQAFRQGWAREATCPGYEFLECRNLDRVPEECAEDGPVNLVVVIEYEKDYLYAWLMEVEFELETNPPIYSKFCKECGERYLKINDNQIYRERLEAFFNDFINEALQKHYLDNMRANIRSIVLSGEASTSRMKELGETARRAVGTKIVRIMTSIEPPEVVAYGAAVWARLVQRSPRTFIIQTGNRVDESLNHDEL